MVSVVRAAGWWKLAAWRSWRPGGLYTHAEFMKLWTGQTISLLGSQITNLALPLTAVLTLHATPAQMGYLGTASRLPFLVVGLFAGVWVDRMRRRPILMISDLGRGVLLATIPLAALLGRLGMEQLYVVSLLAGICTVFFDVAYQAYLPALVGREQLVEGNSKLEVSRSAVQIVGPGIAGTLVGIVTAPIAIVLDALSFFVSSASLWIIRTEEPPSIAPSARRSIWSEIGEGLRVVLGNPLLRAIAGCTATSNLFSSVTFTVLILYLTRDLGMPPALLGLVFGVGSVGFLIGALVAAPAARRLGFGRAILGSMFLSSLGMALIALAGGSLAVAVPLIVAAQLLFGVGVPVYNINQVSLRQAITPHALQGRMNASMRFIVWGTLPIGALLGGALGERIGLRPTLAVGAAGSFLAVLWPLFSPVRALRTAPAPIDD